MAIEDLSHVFIGDPTEHIIKPGVMTEANPIRESLVLWYDFYGRSNLDADRLIVEDKSGSGHRGVLQNFAYTEGSGFEPKGLRFDGVDDFVLIPDVEHAGPEFAWHASVTFKEIGTQFLLDATPNAYYMRSLNATLHSSLYLANDGRQKTISANYQYKVDEPFVYHFQFRDNTLEIYVNGNLMSSSSTTYPMFKATLRKLGQWTSSGLRFSGVFHTFMAYDRALDVNEIAHNYAMERERWR